MLCVSSMIRLTTLTVSCEAVLTLSAPLSVYDLKRREERTHVQEVLLDRAVVDGAVPPSVELDQGTLVLDKGDKVQVCIGLERRGLFERASRRRIGESVLQAF